MPAADSAWLASEWVALPHEEQSGGRGGAGGRGTSQEGQQGQRGRQALQGSMAKRKCEQPPG